MLQDALISMHSVSDSGNEDEDTIDFLTDGFYQFEDDTGHITYLESEITGMAGTRTSVTVAPDRVIIDRVGPVTSRMEFCEGVRSSFLYNTPFGNATMGLRTRHINRSMNAEGGDVEIEYVLDLEHSIVTRNRFHINVSQVGGAENVKPRS